MIKLLLGGSPCTYWSIAQSKDKRETKAEGEGWELFKNYLIAKEKFQPDYFLYENNKSAATAIKEQIKKELHVYDGTFLMRDSGARYIEINSALVSAQNRQRFYVHNCGEVEQPQDRGILLKDLLDGSVSLCDNPKAYCLTANYDKAVAWNTLERHQREMAAEPVIIQSQHGFNNGSVKRGKTPTLTANGTYAHNNKVATQLREKSRTLCALYSSCSQRDLPKDIETNGSLGRQGVIEPYNEDLPINTTKGGKANTVRATCYKDTVRNLVGNDYDKRTCVAKKIPYMSSTPAVYEVKDGLITIRGKQYPLNLSDGFYTIRKLTVAECCRLQTMPDDYCRAVSNTQAYKGLGNGWTAEVIIHILSHALGNVPKNEKILVLSMYDGIGGGALLFGQDGFYKRRVSRLRNRQACNANCIEQLPRHHTARRRFSSAGRGLGVAN